MQKLDRKDDKRYVVKEETKRDILDMLFGPYKTEWRSSSGIINNSDKDIADRLGISLSTVSVYSNSASEKRFAYLNILINIDISDVDKERLMIKYDSNMHKY